MFQAGLILSFKPNELRRLAGDSSLVARHPDIRQLASLIFKLYVLGGVHSAQFDRNFMYFSHVSLGKNPVILIAKVTLIDPLQSRRLLFRPNNENLPQNERFLTRSRSLCINCIQLSE